MVKHFLFIIIALGMQALAQGQFFQLKSLDKDARAARLPSLGTFIVYANGDTLKGTELKKKFSRKGIPNWTLDAKPVQYDSIISYQDDDVLAFFKHAQENNIFIKGSSELVRLFAGKWLSCFGAKVETDNSIMPSKRSPGSSPYDENTRTAFFFYLSKDSLNPDKIIGPLSRDQLGEYIKDYAPAVEQLHKVFGKINGLIINDHNKILSVLEVYNKR